jgi:hypothetical protein
MSMKKYTINVLLGLDTIGYNIVGLYTVRART